MRASIRIRILSLRRGTPRSRTSRRSTGTAAARWSGFVWLANRSRYIPYVVEVDKLGYALTVPQPLTPVALPDVTARMERYEVAAFIRDARSVTSDPQVEDQTLNALLAHTRGAAYWTPPDSCSPVFPLL